jgi:CheY-like chemotaxis protein
MTTTATPAGVRPDNGGSILLVEDNAAHANLIEMALEDAGASASVERVQTGELALERLESGPRPAVVVLDLKLPGIDGMRVLNRIKSDARMRATPVIMLTTSSSDDDRRTAYREHVNSYIVKPLEFAEFETVVREIERYWCQVNMPAPE